MHERNAKRHFNIWSIFMPSFELVNILPFWILGIPLLVGIISYMRMPRQSDLVSRGGHNNAGARG
jgi:hypothetical protein